MFSQFARPMPAEVEQISQPQLFQQISMTASTFRPPPASRRMYHGTNLLLVDRLAELPAPCRRVGQAQDPRATRGNVTCRAGDFAPSIQRRRRGVRPDPLFARQPAVRLLLMHDFPGDRSIEMLFNSISLIMSPDSPQQF